MEVNKWKSFSPEVYTIFWKLELSDIELPSDMYKTQITAKEQQLAAIKGEKADAKKQRQALDTQIKDLQNEFKVQ